MSQIEYIDLSNCDDDPIKPAKVSKANGLKSKHISSIRPKSVALKCIGLSMIKMQYGEKYFKTSTKCDVQNGDIKPSIFKTNIWYSVWLDGQAFIQYPFRHMLEQKYEKSSKCPYNRSLFCQLPRKVARINWIHHMRRGHTRIYYHWRQSLKQNSQVAIDNFFQVLCVICSKNRKFIPISPQEFIQHMIKIHPNFLPFDNYYPYFQHCYICSDNTNSFHQNISHRQMCITAVSKDPNQFGTINFNKCFRALCGKSVVCLEVDAEKHYSFEYKLKNFLYFKRTNLYYWLARKRMEMRQLSNKQTASNASAHKVGTVPPDAPVDLSRFEKVHKPAPSWSTSNLITESARVAPGTIQNFTTRTSDRFYIPVPFPMRNETTFKNVYPDWTRRISVRHSKMTKVNPWFCELCNAMVRNTSVAYSHLKMCHNPVNFIDYQCKSCDKRFLSSQGYKLHFQETRRCPVARKCGICNVSVSVSDIYHHLYTKHQNNFNKVLQLTVCLICRDNITDLWKHLLDIHGIHSSYPGRSTLSPNIPQYTRNAFFNCPKCALTFFSEIELHNHFITMQHHFKCRKCPELRFYMFWEVLHHYQLVHKFDYKPQPLSCELCPPVWSVDTNREENVEFLSTSAKIEHFIKCHNINNCIVVLTKMDTIPDGTQ